MKTRLTRRAAKARQKNPHKWLTDYLGRKHPREPKAKPKEWREVDETKPLLAAPAASGWVVLMVEPRMEGKASEALRDAGYVAWHPQTVEITQDTRRKVRRKVNRPLFPRYLFAAAPAAGGWLSDGDEYGGSGNPSLKALARLAGPSVGMGDCDHVSAIIGPVTAALLADLSERQSRGEFEAQTAVSQFGKNTRVRITDGPFAGLDGIVHRSVKGRVEVLVSFFGGKRPVKLEPQQVVAA